MSTRRKKTKAKGYTISVVADTYDIHPQTLRLYEREGLLTPSRSEGNTRFYTDSDLERLELILTTAIVIIGLFFTHFLPGGVGGDAMRLYFVFKLAPGRKVGATLSVAMDRVLGLLTLLFLAGLSLSLRFNALTRSSPSLHIVYLAVALLGASLVLVVLIFWFASAGLLPELPKPTPFRKAIIESGEALLRFRTHLLTMAFAFLITVVAHLAYYTSYYCAGESLHASGHVASLADILNQAAWGLAGAVIFLASQKIISR